MTRERFAGRHRHVPAVRACRPLVAPLRRSRDRLRLRLDAGPGRARQRGVELPLVISDHADWPELLDTIAETGAPRSLGHARARGRAGALSCGRGLHGPRAGARRLRGRGRMSDGALRRAARPPRLRRIAQRQAAAASSDYFRTTPDPDRGWALAALTDGLPLRLPLRRMLARARSRRSSIRCSTGCRATTSATRPRPSRCCGPTARRQRPALAGARRGRRPRCWRRTPQECAGAHRAAGSTASTATGRWALLKLLTGALRVGVSARLAKTALAAYGGRRCRRDRGGLARR